VTAFSTLAASSQSQNQNWLFHGGSAL